jgi:hypothetical protein
VKISAISKSIKVMYLYPDRSKQVEISALSKRIKVLYQSPDRSKQVEMFSKPKRIKVLYHPLIEANKWRYLPSPRVLRYCAIT